MTKDEAIDAMWEKSGHGTRREDIATAYEAGVAAERERCAKLCENEITFEPDDPGAGFAKLIRALPADAPCVEKTHSREFRYPLGHVAGATATVAALRAALDFYSPDMPVFAAWEGVHAYVDPADITVEIVSKGLDADACECVVIDVSRY